MTERNTFSTSGSSGLAGLHVLELGDMVSAAYATKLMADLGAEVVKVEEPPGDRARQRGPFPGDRVDPQRSGLFSFLNTNKKGVSFGISSDSLRPLVEWADILVHNYSRLEMTRLGIDYRLFREWNAPLVMCSITPFGLTGPHADYRACEMTVAHGGGWAYISPGASSEPENPPLKAFGHQASYQAGIAAAMVSLAAFFRRCCNGIGEHIDLSAQAFVASFLEQTLPHYAYAGRVASRLGQRMFYPWAMYPCKDGLIFLVVPEDDQWKRLVDLMGNPEWAQWEIFATAYQRSQNSDVLRGHLSEWTRQWTVSELFHESQKLRICFAPVFDLRELSTDPHLRARRFFVPAPQPSGELLEHPGAPYRLKNDWWGLRAPAPRLGEHNALVESVARSARPPDQPASDPVAGALGLLEKVRVVDFSWAWAGPFCALQLAYLGADVVKVESGRRLDLSRRIRIFPPTMEFGPNRSGFYNQYNQSKRSLQLNLTGARGQEIARALVRASDVVVENYSTGVMERFGLGFEDLKRLKPDIIMASISGYGHTGPYRNYLSYGPATGPISGLSSLTGYPGGEAREMGISYGDPNGGLNAAMAICAALVARDRTGEGQHIDISLWEATVPLVAEGWMDFVMNDRLPERIGNRDPWMAPHNCYPCAGEQNWVTIACADDSEWVELAGIIGGEDLKTDARFRSAAARKKHEDELDALVSAWTRQRDRWDITHELQARGIAAFPSMSSEDLVKDQHLNSRGFFVAPEHPEVGRRIHSGKAWRLHSCPEDSVTAAPLLGEHTDEILADVLGLDRSEIEELAKIGVTTG